MYQKKSLGYTLENYAKKITEWVWEATEPSRTDTLSSFQYEGRTSLSNKSRKSPTMLYNKIIKFSVVNEIETWKIRQLSDTNYIHAILLIEGFKVMQMVKP